MPKLIAVLSALMLVSAASWADEASAEGMMEKPSISTSQTTVVTATVVAINHETRAVTLRGPEGEAHSFVVGEEARNLDQVNIGDTVVATYLQSMTIEVVDGDGDTPGAGAMSIVEHAGKGAEPGMTEVEAVVVTATLVDIDFDNNIFTLKGPKGNTQEYQAVDPENLKKVNVGDIVVMTYTESVGLSVEKSTIE